MATAAQVLLLTADDARRRAWSAALAGRCRIQLPDEEPTAAKPDVVVTDQPLSVTAAAAGEGRLARGEVGVIAVGLEIPADVSLPGDHSPRELRLACLLLSEIVRLRWQRELARRKEKVLSHLALSDSLTGLPNRRAWDEHFAECVSRAGEGGEGEGPYCLALFDLDHFKLLNDERGHVAGDACLKAVAARLAAAARRGDFVARLGGDEFAALLAGIEPGQAGVVVERIRRSAELTATSDLPAATLSAGWTCLPAPGNSENEVAADAAMNQADSRLRQAKQAGRNRALGG